MEILARNLKIIFLNKNNKTHKGNVYESKTTVQTCIKEKIKQKKRKWETSILRTECDKTLKEMKAVKVTEADEIANELLKNTMS